MIFRLNDDDIQFPPVELAEEDGLLAVGGDLTEERLLQAYHLGIFPWYSEETPILWYSPHERFVLFPDRVKVSKSMKQVLKSGKFTITEDRAFSKVIMACAEAEREGQDGTWILQEMQEAYNKLHKAGFAHSVEVWFNNELVGGLYGVRVGKVFCGESMFSRISNASKSALIWMCQHKGYQLIDCQVHTEHLESMGAEFISREQYMAFLNS
ncbi:leucyl/phenylalanyl-tRNA--protein transferase [Desertivirga arenae]|uniref:leucyl/phenylalanyl-tRNA--protein transferase n=1 Tax=Desertivirga arenae TaxID=2810309 RepID=UPI001A957932|nr:leucyl/phenylalanyl-tRNA--protein transferase [Pedobacter sp. SYSU D00823]